MPSKRTLPRVCKQCGADFLIEPFRVAQGAGIHCSRECRAAARRGVSKPDPRGLVMNCVCDACGKAFHIRPAFIRAGGGRFCSMECRRIGDRVPVIIPDDERDLIYLAGIVDGEGTITSMNHVSRATGNPSMHLRMSVANTDPGLMQWLYETFGGTVNAPRPTRSPRHKPVQLWYVNAGSAVALCQRLLPYLKIKRRHAEILIALFSLTFTYDNPANIGRYVSSETYAARAVLLEELQRLNHRGLLSTP